MLNVYPVFVPADESLKFFMLLNTKNIITKYLASQIVVF